MSEDEWLACNDPAAMLSGLSGVGTPLWHAVASVTPGGVPKPWPLSDRKARLFACACGRELARDAKNFHGQTRTEVETTLSACEDAADAGIPDFRNIQGVAAGSYLLNQSPQRMAGYVAELREHRPEFAALLRDIVGNPFLPVERTDLPPLIRQLHPQHWPRARWLTPDVLALARRAYDARDWAVLPVLADAMEEAGCPVEEMREGPLGTRWLCTGCESRVELKSYFRLQQWFCDRCGWRKPDGVKGTRTARTPNPLLAHLRGPGPHARGCWVLDLVLGRE